MKWAIGSVIQQIKAMLDYAGLFEAALQVFTGKAGCSACHTVGATRALFTGHRQHNTGIGYQAFMGTSLDQQRVLVAPGRYLEVDADTIASVSERPPAIRPAGKPHAEPYGKHLADFP